MPHVDDRPWPEIVLEDWKDFVGKVERFSGPRSDGLEFNFRGQANAEWSLVPSIVRLFGKDPAVSAQQALAIEKNACEQFKFHIGPRIRDYCSEQNLVELWMLMQHYGAPTRVLDWTRSPFVAAYFAVADHWDKDGSIWFINQSLYEGLAWSYFKFGYPSQHPQPTPADFFQTDVDKPTYLSFFSSTYGHDRSIAQQGIFSISTYILDDHAPRMRRVALNSCEQTAQNMGRFTIPAAHKPTFLRHLRSMNIAANALFPGLDGIGRSVAESVRLRTTSKPAKKNVSGTEENPN